jgi:hypothetical protein
LLEGNIMADARENGMRIGAAANQASNVIAGMSITDLTTIISTHEALLHGFLTNMEAAQDAMTAPTPLASVTPVVTPQAAAQAEASMAEAFPGTTATPPVPVAAAPVAAGVAGYNTAFSGSNKPLDIGTPGLDAWLVTQCKALGIDKVWDNRGKPNYIAAINEGKDKTPPPFRSATEGVDKSLWPPS